MINLIAIIHCDKAQVIYIYFHILMKLSFCILLLYKIRFAPNTTYIFDVIIVFSKTSFPLISK